MVDLDNRDNQAIVLFEASSGDGLLEGSMLVESHLDLEGNLTLVLFVEREPVSKGGKTWRRNILEFQLIWILVLRYPFYMLFLITCLNECSTLEF